MAYQDIRKLLSVRNRSHAHLPGKMLLGPTGARLWMDYLDPVPGFAGRADFIHKVNLPLLFSVTVDERELCLITALSTWKPDETVIFYENDQLSFSERKTITWNDCAVCAQKWSNRSSDPLTLRLQLPSGAVLGQRYKFPLCTHGILPVMLCQAEGFDTQGVLTLQPGEEKELLIAAALCLQGEEEVLASRLDAILNGETPEKVLDLLCEQYMAWFDDVPSFACSDPMLDVCWYYRFYILRKNLACPGVGALPTRTFYEGRAHVMAKTVYGPSAGWEFSRLIPLSTPLQVTDARWLKDSSVAADALDALRYTLDEEGVFAVTAIDKVWKEYANCSSWALYLWYLITGDLDTVKKLLPAFKEDARNVFRVTGCSWDALQIERTHALTGKEYQPGYWFFGKDCFPQKVRPAKEGYSPLKRVDRSIYSYLNFTGLARLCELAGDTDAAWFAETAGRMCQDVLTKMWDDPSGFFYDLHHETDEKAYVKSIVAYYPFWADITQKEHLRAFNYLFSKDYFSLGSGYASTARDCPLFSANGGWRGDYFKGRNGCMWNGPSWPYTTGIALDAVAIQSKKHGHIYDAQFAQGLHEYTMEHFRDGDIHQPFLVEFYNAATGEPLSNEPDYNHSYYIDLIVRHVAGIEVDDAGVCFCPVDTGLRWMELEDVQVRGHRFDVKLEKKGEQQRYTVWVDGTIAYEGNGMESVRLLNW